MKLSGPVFLIVFDDPDIPLETFAGERAEELAKRRFEQLLMYWSAGLYQRVDDGRRSPSTVSTSAGDDNARSGK